MNNKEPLIHGIDQIDGKYLEEYYDRRTKREAKRKSLIKYCSIAASIILVVVISTAMLLPMSRKEPTDIKTPVVDVTDKTDKPVNEREDVYTVIYAEENQNDVAESEIYIEPPLPGEVRFDLFGELSGIMKSEDPYEKCVFAVSMSFSMNFNPSQEYNDLIGEREKRSELMWERYNNEFLSHIKLHTEGCMDWNCDECLRLYDLHEQDEKDIDTINREANDIYNAEYKVHTDKVNEYAEAYLESICLGFRNVTVIWCDGPDNTENAPVWNKKIAHMTKEQLESFEIPPDLGIEFALIPEWMDTGENIIYRDSGLYPITLE